MTEEQLKRQAEVLKSLDLTEGSIGETLEKMQKINEKQKTLTGYAKSLREEAEKDRKFLSFLCLMASSHVKEYLLMIKTFK